MFVPAVETSRSRKKGGRGRNVTVAAERVDAVAVPRLPQVQAIAAILLLASLGAARTADALPFLDLSNGLTGWTQNGDVMVTGTTSAFTVGGSPFSLTPAAGYNMVRIAANGGPTGVNATLGLSANSLEAFLNNGNGSITNFGLITTTHTFNPGTYSFSWAYAAEDYQPYNDGGVFSLVGGGTQTLISLARNGSSPTDLSGPSPATLILGSYGSTAWLTTSFTVTTSGSYQVGFAAYNWDDTSLSPNLFVSAIAGTFTGTPVQTTGPTAPPVIGGSGGNVSGDVFDPSSPAYAEPVLTFEGGTLQYTADTTTAKDVVLNGPGGSIDTNGNAASVTGTISGTGPLVKEGAGTLSLTGTNTFTGGTEIASGTLALSGSGSIAASSSVVVDDTLDISGTAAGASVQTLAGSGAVELGTKNLTVIAGSTTFAGAINGTGGLALAGGEMTLSGANTFTGTTTISSGTLKLASGGSLGDSGAIVNNGVLDISALSAAASVKTLSGSGAVILGSHALTLTNASGVFSGGFAGTGAVNIASGVLTLDGTSTHTGGTNVQSGAKVIVGSDAALGASSGIVVLNGGTLENVASLTLNHSISLTSASTFNTVAGTAIAGSSALSGNGALVKTGTGTLVLSGDNSQWGQSSDPATGGLTLNDGMVVIGSANGLGNGSVTLNSGVLQTATDVTLSSPMLIGGGNVSFDTVDGTTARITGDIATTGGGSVCFAKTGVGTLIISGAATIESGTCVQQGSLYSNGQLNSVVTVASSGTLRGTGTITGPVTVYGTLAPGNSPGVLHATASIAMTSGSVYQEDINGTGTGAGPGNYSRLIISGAGNQFVAGGATLAPNLVNIIGSDLYVPYVPNVGDAFRIITAEGGIVGEFAALTQPLGLADATRMAVYYNVGNSNSIDLFVVPMSYGAYVAASEANGNALSTAQVLDQLAELRDVGTATGVQEELLYAVDTQNGTPLDVVATQLSGEIHAALLAAAPLTDRWLIDTIGHQLVSESADDRTAAWVDVGASQGDWKSDAAASGFDTTRSQIAAGWDLVKASATRAGVGFMHGKTDVSAQASSGSMTQETVFVYGQQGMRGIILEGLAAYGMGDWETSRSVALAGTALKANPDGHNALFSTALRLPVTLQRIALEPYVRATWERVSREGFDEGASPFGLTADHYSASGTRFMAGLQGGSAKQNPFAARVTSRFNVGVGTDQGDLVNPMMDAALAGMSTRIGSPDVSRTYVQGSLVGTARFTDRLYGYLGLSGELRDGKSSEFGANLGVRMSL